MLEHCRDKLGLNNRTMADAFQVQPDRFSDFMAGDDNALSETQKTYIGLELAHLVNAEDMDREYVETTLKMTPAPGAREVLGITNK